MVDFLKYRITIYGGFFKINPGVSHSRVKNTECTEINLEKKRNLRHIFC